MATFKLWAKNANRFIECLLCARLCASSVSPELSALPSTVTLQPRHYCPHLIRGESEAGGTGCLPKVTRLEADGWGFELRAPDWQSHESRGAVAALSARPRETRGGPLGQPLETRLILQWSEKSTSVSPARVGKTRFTFVIV